MMELVDIWHLKCHGKLSRPSSNLGSATKKRYEKIWLFQIKFVSLQC